MKKLMADYYDGEQDFFVIYIKVTEKSEKSIPTSCQCRDDFSDWTNCYLRSATFLHRQGLYRCEYKAY